MSTNSRALKKFSVLTIAQQQTPVCLHAIAQPLVDTLHGEGAKAWEALAAIMLDPMIGEWLERNNEKLYCQCETALGIQSGDVARVRSLP